MRIIFIWITILLFHFSIIAQQETKITLSLYENPINETIKLIDNATTIVQAVVYKFEEKKLLYAIENAVSRGVEVQLIVDAKESETKRV